MQKKSFFKIGILFLFFFVSSCFSKDDYEPFSINLNVPNLISIDEQQSYYVGNLLYINANFSRYLPEPGFVELLDIYKTTKSDKFGFYFNFQRKNAYGGWSDINVYNALTIYKGYKDVYGLAAVLNTQNNTYELRFSIPLLETGTYRIRIPNEIRSYNNKGVNLNITTTINSINTVSDGYLTTYEFIIQ